MEITLANKPGRDSRTGSFFIQPVRRSLKKSLIDDSIEVIRSVTLFLSGAWLQRIRKGFINDSSSMTNGP